MMLIEVVVIEMISMMAFKMMSSMMVAAMMAFVMAAAAAAMMPAAVGQKLRSIQKIFCNAFRTENYETSKKQCQKKA